MTKDRTYPPAPAGPPIGTVIVQSRPPISKDNPTTPVTAETPPQTEYTIPEKKPSFDDKLPNWVRASKPKNSRTRLVIWWTYCVLRAYKLSWIPVPKPFWSYRNRIAKNIAIIRAKRHRIMGIVAAISRKGGTGKSSVSTWMNSLFSLYIDIVSVVFDADSGSDAAGGRYNIQPDADHLTSLQTAELILRHEWRPAKEDLTRKVAYDRLSQAYVIPHAINMDLKPREMEQVAFFLKPACDLLFLDTAPGIMEKSTVGAVFASTTTVLTARHNVKDDMHSVTLTLDHPEYELRNDDKLDRVIIALSAVKRRNFNKRTQYLEAEKFGVRPEQVVLIPFQRYLYNTEQVNPAKVSGRVIYAWTTLMLAIANANERYNEKYPVEDLDGEDEVRELNPAIRSRQQATTTNLSASADTR